MSDEASGEPRWPATIGALGILIGILILLDQLTELPTLGWGERQWQRLLPLGTTDLVTQFLPPLAVRLLLFVVELALGVLLLSGAWRLRQRQRRGAGLLRLWSWLAIAYVPVIIALAAWVQFGIAASAVPADVPWRGPAALALLLVALVLLAFPVFLLLWLARPEIREQYEAWPEG